MSLLAMNSPASTVRDHQYHLLSNKFREAWDRTSVKLKSSCGLALYNAWLADLSFLEVRDNALVLNVPGVFIASWIESHFMDRIVYVFRRELGDNSVSIELKSNLSSRSREEKKTKQMIPKNENGRHLDKAAILESGLGVRANRELLGVFYSNKKGNLEDIGSESTSTCYTVGRKSFLYAKQDCNNDAPHSGGSDTRCNPEQITKKSRYSFENFMVDSSNRFAFEAVRDMVSCDTKRLGGLLFLMGPIGMGKTHLMRAAYSLMQQKQGKKVCYLTAEQFTSQFITALRKDDIFGFKNKMRALDVLMMDDIQFLSGKEKAQEEFFHTFDVLLETGKQVIISADRSPSDLSDMKDRIRSRMNCGLTVAIGKSTFDLRLQILQSKASDIGESFSEDTLKLLAQKITSDARELEGALYRVAAKRRYSNTSVNQNSVEYLLEDMMDSVHKSKVTTCRVIEVVSDISGVSVHQIKSKFRGKDVVRARHVAMSLAKEMTEDSYPMIGREFGGKDHTTVMYACKKIEKMVSEDVSLSEFMDSVRKELLSPEL